MIKEIYSKVWYIEEEKEFGKYKRNSNKVWEEIKCKSKKTRKFGNSREKKL